VRVLSTVCVVGAVAVLAWAGTATGAATDVRVNPPQGALVHGQKTTDTSNGGEALAASTAVVSVSLRAACANTVDVHVGASTVNASSSKGRTLAACETLDLDVKNLDQVYLDSGTTAATVEYVGVQGP